MVIELQEIIEINGKRVECEHNNRKKEFKSLEELEKYRKCLKHKLDKDIYFVYKEIDVTNPHNHIKQQGNGHTAHGQDDSRA